MNSNLSFPILNSELPQGWRWVKLGEVCMIDSNQVLPNTDLVKELPYIGLEHIESGTGKVIGKINDKDGKLIESITFQFDCRHVLYGKLRPYLNKVVTPDFEGRCTTELLPLLPKDGCDRDYLAWIFRWEETVSEAMRHKTGTRMPRADMDELFKMLIPLPPLPEQIRIAAKIQEMMQEVEHARTACEKQLEAAKALPAAHLKEVFESEEAKKWERRRLEEICQFSSGKFIEKEKVRSQGAYPVYGANGVIGFTDEKIFDKAVIIVGRVGSCGMVNKTLGPAWITDNTIVLHPLNQITFDFLYLILKSIKLEDLKAASVQPLITQKNLRPLLIFLPPLSAQQRIAAEIKYKMVEVENLQSTIQNQQSALNVLPQAILRKAFRG